MFKRLWIRLESLIVNIMRHFGLSSFRACSVNTSFLATVSMKVAQKYFSTATEFFFMLKVVRKKRKWIFVSMKDAIAAELPGLAFSRPKNNFGLF